jgi:hypothetical protein
MKMKITEKGINFLLIFILGFLVGAALKSEAQKRVTIGFNDYLVPKYKQDINLTAPSPAASQNQQPTQPGSGPDGSQNPGQPNQPAAPSAPTGGPNGQ